MQSPWFIPPSPPWRDEVGNNPRVSAALACAYERLRPNGQITGEVLACLADVMETVMSKGQRLRILYIVSSCRAAEDPPALALVTIDEALELAVELHETRAQVDLLLLRSAVNRSITQIPDAADDLRDCLQALVTLNLRDDWSDDDLLLTLAATLRLAAQEFLSGAYDECEGWLDHAALLLPRVGRHTDSLARFHWLRALLLRWRGDYDTALAEAISAIGFYRTLHDPQMLSRIEATTGDILLDLAERSSRLGDDTATAAYLLQSEPYIRRAVEIAVASDYTASEVGARIIRARLQLLQGIPGDRKLLLEELANMAWQHQDMSAVCKAYTAIGREYEANNDELSAKELYRRAIAVVKESRAIADSVWAQRALWRLAGEMNSQESC